MSAAWESLHRATLELASADPLKQRLTIAFSSHLKELEPHSLPPELRARFQSLIDRLTAVRPLRGETAVAATVRKMSNEEAQTCAQEIVKLLASVTYQQPAVTRNKPRQLLSLYSAEA